MNPFSGMSSSLKRQLPPRKRWVQRQLDEMARQLQELHEVSVAQGKRQVELRRGFEVRALLAHEEAIQATRKHLSGEQEDLRKWVEERVTLARDEAKGYADQGLGSLARSLAAATRALVDVNKRLGPAEQKITERDEMQAVALRDSGQSTSQRMEPRIINQAKVDASRTSGLRLNVGCGHIQLDDYVNVDQRELPGVDVLADATHLPFDDGTVLEIRSSHLVEHFPEHILERVLLPYWLAKLQNGGTLTTVVSDGAAMLQAVSNGSMDFDDFREVLFGAQDYDGDFHYNLVTPASYARSLSRAGFIEIREDYVGQRTGKCFEFMISARKA